MYHLLSRLGAAIGIYVTVAVVTTGYFWTGLRNAMIDCDKDSTQHNAGACAVDIVEVVASSIVIVASSAATVYSLGVVGRDVATFDHSDLVYVDGKAMHKLDVFNYAWMKENLLEDNRKYILHNSTKGGGKVMTEAWKEGKIHKHTHYAYSDDDQPHKRSGEAYIHTSYEESDIKFEFPNIKTSYTDAYNAAQLIFDNFANDGVDSNCVGFEFHPAGKAFESAWLGLEGSYVSTNNAPTCKNPETNGGYTQIGDMQITGY